MQEQSFTDELKRYIMVIRRWAWLLVLASITAALVAYFISRQMTPIYRASTTLLINEAPASQGPDYTSVLTSERLTQTYAQLLTKNPVLDSVIQSLGLQTDVEDLKKTIDVQPVRDTQLIVVQVERANPVVAADIANAIVTEFARQNQEVQAARYRSSKQSLETQLAQVDEQILTANTRLGSLGDDPQDQAEKDRLETSLAQYRQTYAYLLQSYEQVRLAEAQSTSSITQAEPAVPPLDPVRPRTLLNTAIAMTLGFLFTVGFIFLVEALDDTIRDPEELQRELGLPILGIIARYDSKKDFLITATQPRSPTAEAFRGLRTNIQFASVDVPINTLLVTSPTPAEGKTTVAANLAAVIAQNGKPVVLLECDLRKPRVHQIFQLENHLGVSDLFVQPQVHLDGNVQSTDIPNLSAVTAGALPPNPSELLGSEKMREILHVVGSQTEMILIDTPPILAVTDAMVLAPRVDGVLLIVKPGRTKLTACKQAVEQLHRVGARLLGVVLNDVRFNRSRFSYYNYQNFYYSYAELYGDSSSKEKVKKARRKQKS